MTARLAALASTIAETLVLSVLLYVALRWIIDPLMRHLPAGIVHAVDLAAAALLLPEFLLTCASRRVVGRPAPFAHAYGDAVCSVAIAVHRGLTILLDALQPAAARIGHREALAIGIAVVVLIHVL